MDEKISKNIAKNWWHQCISCSEAAMTTQMRSFGLEAPAYEQAIHAFSGGFMHSGAACGLLTGAALAAGFLAKERFHDEETRIEATLYATIMLAQAHPELTTSINCKDITEVSLTTLGGRLSYLLKGKGSLCGRLHIKWASQAHEIIEKAFIEFNENRSKKNCANCAVATLKKLGPSFGMSVEDATVVAGLAGGVGLLGNVCGALAAGVFALSAAPYLRQTQESRDSQIRGALQELWGSAYQGPAKQLQQDFNERFSEVTCSKIVGRKFLDIDDHANFISEGGCKEVIEFVTSHATEGERDI